MTLHFEAQYSYTNTTQGGQPVWYSLPGPLAVTTPDYKKARRLILARFAEDTADSPETAYRIAITDPDQDDQADEMPAEWRYYEDQYK